jgi:hypothetical protein
MRKATIGLALLAVLLIAVPAMAQTETGTIEIEVFGTVTGRTEGEIVPITTEPVPEGMVGWTCSGVAAGINNESQHLNNDFIISTGGTTGEILNWEAVSGATTPMTGTVVLGSTIDVSLRMGPSGVSSGGVVIILSCSAPTPPTTVPPTTVPPTTVPPTTPPTTVPPTTPPTTTPGTTEAPPEGGVSAGGGATAGGGAEAAVLWLTGGALALLGGATVLAMRRTTGRE